MAGFEPHSEGTPSPAEIRHVLGRILSSRCFADAERLRQMLAWLVDQSLQGRSKEIKESVIALEVFGRNPASNPQADALVRVQMGNLRRHLARFYETEGREELILLVIPTGSYAPCFAWNVPASAAPSPALRWNKRGLAAAGAAVVLAILAINTQQRRSAPASVAVLPFDNLSGRPELAYVAAGLTAELTSILAHSPDLNVAATPANGIAASQSLTDAARQLGVRYLISGSVRPMSGQAPQPWSVTVRVADSKTGSYAWSDHYECSAARLEALPAEIATAIAASLPRPVPPGRRPRQQRQSSSSSRAARAAARTLARRSRSVAGGSGSPRRSRTRVSAASRPLSMAPWIDGVAR